MAKVKKVIVEIDDKKKKIEKFINKFKPVAKVFSMTSHSIRNNGRKYKTRIDERYIIYPFIPIEIRPLVLSFIGLAKYLNIRDGNNSKEFNFLDAGCGIGNVLYFVEMMMDVDKWSQKSLYHGLELDKKVAELGRDIFNIPNSNSFSRAIFNCDILKFRRYKKYNVIYYYCPIELSPLQMLFEERLEDLIAPGTIIIPKLKKSPVLRNNDKRFKRIEVQQYGYAVCDFFEKINNGKRKYTNISPSCKNMIPERYLKIFNKHVNRYEFKLNTNEGVKL